VPAPAPIPDVADDPPLLAALVEDARQAGPLWRATPAVAGRSAPLPERALPSIVLL
jgi:hypothetical protein